MSIDYGFLVPHPPIIINKIGRGQEKIVEKTIDAYHKIGQMIAEIKPDTIIISSPHSTVYADYFHISPGKKTKGDLGQFGARDIEFEKQYDYILRDKIIEKFKKFNIHGGTYGEKSAYLDHGTILPMYFIDQYYRDYKLIRISPSGLSLLDHYQAGMLINGIENKKIVWVASGDLSHKLRKDGPYGLAKEGVEFDKELVEAIKEGDFLRILKFNPDFYHKAAECGLGSLMMMCGIFDGYDIETEVLSYEGTFGVGYAVASFKRLKPNSKRHFFQLYKDNLMSFVNDIKQREDEYVRLARASLEYYILHKRRMDVPENLSDELLNRKAGVFVSLHKDKRLRGCIGTIYPVTSSIAKEIIENAISAGTRDYRFSSVKSSELSSIEYSVDVLGEPEPIDDKSLLDIERYGVIVRSGPKTGLLLPNIEGIDSVDHQIQIAKRKAGIAEDESFTMERFEVIRHH